MARTITPEQLTVIRNLSRCGHTNYYIANALGITPANFSYHKQNNQELRDALSIGTDGVMLDVKSRLTSIALGGSAKDSISASTFLLSRYESTADVSADEQPSDDELAQGIMNDLRPE